MILYVFLVNWWDLLIKLLKFFMLKIFFFFCINLCSFVILIWLLIVIVWIWIERWCNGRIVCCRGRVLYFWFCCLFVRMIIIFGILGCVLFFFVKMFFVVSLIVLLNCVLLVVKGSCFIIVLKVFWFMWFLNWMCRFVLLL